MSAEAHAPYHRAKAEMSTCRKCLIGGLGALAPIVLNLAVVDFKTALSTVTVIALAAYLLRVCILFGIGGGWVYLHKKEKDPLRIFELGIVAPTMILALLNGANSSGAKTVAASGLQPAATISAVTDLLVPTAYAQTASGDVVRKFSPPKETATEQFWRGLTGEQSERVWFVVVGDSRDLGDAKSLARRINQNSPNFKAEVYGDDESYKVVIGGGNQTLSEAKALKRRALEAKVSTDKEITLLNPWATK